jgi:transposase-like protein
LLPPESAAIDAVAREVGIGADTLERWREDAPEELRASPQDTRADRKRIKELERELPRKDRALAETAALLVLSKKVQAIFNKGEDE